ncbi:unnamed protein product [Musa acuminata var. zebrina]
MLMMDKQNWMPALIFLVNADKSCQSTSTFMSEDHHHHYPFP